MAKKNKEVNSKNNYIFPDVFGKWMGKLDQRTQYEGGMMATTLIMIGLVAMTIYIWIYMNWGLGFKILTTFNAAAGLLLMISNLVTLFQQYQAFMGYKQTQELIHSNPSQTTQKMSAADIEEMSKYLPETEIAKILKAEEAQSTDEGERISSTQDGERRLKNNGKQR